MSWANPAILWALPVGLIPIVIYYLLRFRALKVVWGANYVLELALARLRRRLHWDQMLLIALRTVACLLLVAAFARPVLTRQGGVVSGGGVHHVVVLDGSYSMLAGNERTDRWQRTLAALRALVSTWGRGEQWSLYFLDRQPHWVVDGRRVTTAEESLAELDWLAPAETNCSISAALSEVAERFPRGRAEIYLFVDDQATAWEGVESIRLPAELEADVYWVCPPLDRTANVAVTSVRPAIERVLMRHPQRVFVTLQSYAAWPLDDVAVELLVDGVLRDRTSVALLPGQQTTTAFDLRFDEPGSRYVTARLADDALMVDNTMSAGLEAVKSLEVLVLRDPARREDKFASAWGFLEVVDRARRLAAEEGSQPGPAPRAPQAALPAIDWKLGEPTADAIFRGAADVIYLDGGVDLSPELVGRLAAYVDSGGGLVLGADPTIDRAVWNRLLGERDLLPAAIGPLSVERTGGERFRSLSRSRFEALALRPLENDEYGDISKAKFYNWFTLRSDDKRSDVLLRFDDGSPWAVRQDRQLGQVLLLASGLAGRGHNLFVREFALPLFTQLIEAAAAAVNFPRTMASRGPARLLVADPASLQAVTFGQPDREPLAAETRPLGDRTLAVVDQPHFDTGLYRWLVIREDGARPIWCGVQGERVDSDLTPLAPERRAAIKDRLGATEAADWAQLDQLLASARAGTEWHPWAIAFALVVLVGEMLFQRRFAPRASRR